MEMLIGRSHESNLIRPHCLPSADCFLIILVTSSLPYPSDYHLRLP